MQDTYIATLFGIACLLFWGTGSWILSNASKKSENAFETNLAVQLPTLLIMAIIALLAFDKIHISLEHLAYLFLAEFFFLAAFVLLIKALNKGPAGVVIPLENTYPLYVLVLSIIFLGQNFSPYQVVATILLIAGAGAIAFDHTHNFMQLKRLSADKELALLASIAFGLGNYFINIIISSENWQTLYVIGNLISVPLTYLAASLYSKNSFRAINYAIRDKTSLTCGFILTFGSLLFYIGGNIVGSVVLIIAVASAQPLVASVLGRIFNKEILAWHQRIGAVVVVLGILILNIN